ncbi:MAG: alcohol dehydrogenase catalytic domain-containing protein [Bacillota bacterium]|nr:alcohol dehydrogenase catalytic domain-containing protein [Bacillota bacterium]
MRAAVLAGPKSLTVEGVPCPRPEPGEVLVRVMATAICGTDVAVYAGKYPVTYPLIPGHESSGVVAEVGEGVVGVVPGDRVVLNSLVFCGFCRWCRRGDTSLCVNGGLLGRERAGTFAEYVAVRDSQCHRLPADMTFVDATNLAVLATVVRAQRRAHVSPGMSVVVIGQGVSGLLHTQLARAAGAVPVIGISRSQWKLELALKLGAHRTMSAHDEGVVAAVRAETEGGPDLVIDTVGTGETMRLALDMVGRGGTVLAFGVDPGPVPSLSTFTLYDKELRVLGSRAQTALDIELAIKAVKGGAVDIKCLTTHRHGLDELPRVMQRQMVKPEGLRTVIEIGEAGSCQDRRPAKEVERRCGGC